MKRNTKKPKFFLPGDKVKIKGKKGTFIIKCWSKDHTDVLEYEEEIYANGEDYIYWEYSTTISAWHKYKDITFVSPGWMRKMLTN